MPTTLHCITPCFCSQVLYCFVVLLQLALSAVTSVASPTWDALLTPVLVRHPGNVVGVTPQRLRGQQCPQVLTPQTTMHKTITTKSINDVCFHDMYMMYGVEYTLWCCEYSQFQPSMLCLHMFTPGQRALHKVQELTHRKLLICHVTNIAQPHHHSLHLCVHTFCTQFALYT